MTPMLKSSIRDAASRALEYWPNSHLGDRTRLQDLRSAFLMIRLHAEYTGNIWEGVYALDRDADRHMDM